MKKGRCGTMTHDYKRNGATSLFATLNVLDGAVIGECMPRHRRREFLRLKSIDERSKTPVADRARLRDVALIQLKAMSVAASRR